MLRSVDLALIEQLFDGLPDNPFFVKDSALRYVAANRSMLRLCGVRDRAKLIGQKADSFFPSRLAARYEALDRQVIASGRAVTNNLDLSSGAGPQPIWLVFSRFPVRDGDGRVVGVAASARALARPDRRDPTYRRVAAVARDIRASFQGPLDLAGLAEVAAVSPSQLERDFRRVFAMTPQAFHQQIRIENALGALEGDASITAIAHDCGYSDHSAFTRRFRALVGMSPRDWRRHLSRNST